MRVSCSIDYVQMSTQNQPRQAFLLPDNRHTLRVVFDGSSCKQVLQIFGMDVKLKLDQLSRKHVVHAVLLDILRRVALRGRLEPAERKWQKLFVALPWLTFAAMVAFGTFVWTVPLVLLLRACMMWCLRVPANIQHGSSRSRPCLCTETCRTFCSGQSMKSRQVVGP